jgi:endonuclease-8
VPEGDSVFRLAARLRSALDGQRVASGELRGGPAAGARLDGWNVLEHDTHGKHLLTRFDSGLTLHTHLRMQGSWTITGPGKRVPRRVERDVRVRLALASGSTAWGVDVPIVELVDIREERSVVGHLGPDPLRADWDAAEAERRLTSRPERGVAAALLDQRAVAGFGNLWANELCFLRGVDPLTPIGAVDVAALLATGARALTVSATVRDMYQTTTGSTRRGERHWVVGRAGRPCLRCGTTISVRAETPGDPERRRTWWCSRCQPLLTS